MSVLRIDRVELEEFVPHSGRMLLLDGIVDWSDDYQSLTASAGIREGNPFFNPDTAEVPVVVGFEYMAQTIGALSGLERHLRGDSEPRIGYIIGVRAFEGLERGFPAGSEILVRVRELFRDGPAVSFDCRIERAGKSVARGTVNAFEPERRSDEPSDAEKEEQRGQQ